MRTIRGAKAWVAALVAVAMPLASLTPALAQAQAPAQAEAKADRILEGKILGEDGKPIEKATVKVRNLDTGQEFTSAPTGTDGSYKLTKLPPGRYEVAVQTERGMYLGNRTVDLVNKQAQTYSFSLKNVPPEEAVKQAQAARGEEEEKEKPKAGARPPVTPSETSKVGFWSNPYTAILAGVAIAVGAAIAIDNLRGEKEASPSSP